MFILGIFATMMQSLANKMGKVGFVGEPHFKRQVSGLLQSRCQGGNWLQKPGVRVLDIYISQQCVKDNKELSGYSADQKELQKRQDYDKKPDSKPQRRAGRDKSNKAEQHLVHHCPIQKEGTETCHLEVCGDFTRRSSMARRRKQAG